LENLKFYVPLVNAKPTRFIPCVVLVLRASDSNGWQGAIITTANTNSPIDPWITIHISETRICAANADGIGIVDVPKLPQLQSHGFQRVETCVQWIPRKMGAPKGTIDKACFAIPSIGHPAVIFAIGKDVFVQDLSLK
jgi:hypothetical protein